jgi:two-component sensor histidine kinase
MRERFKLAQLCTMTKMAESAKVIEIFGRFRERILAMAEAHTDDPLGPAVAKLANSLFETGHGRERRSSDGGTIVPLLIAGKRQPVKPISASVDPGPV